MSIAVRTHYPILPSLKPQKEARTVLNLPLEISTPLQLWTQAGFCDAEGRLAFIPTGPSQPLKNKEKFTALLTKQVTLKDKNICFEKYLKKVQEAFPTHRLYLRGSYASYLIEPLRELKDIIDEFITMKPETAEIMEAGYQQLFETAGTLPEPADADWALISNIQTNPEDLGPIKGRLIKVNAELAEVDFLTAKNETFTNLNIARKNDLTLTEDPIIIASLRGFLDLLIGSPALSPCLFSYDNRYLPFEIENPPIALMGDYWQSTLDHALGIIRLEPRHEMDFKALLIAIKHRSQGRTLQGWNISCERAFNEFVKKCPVDLLYNAMESKMPKERPADLCYVMNILSLTEDQCKRDELWKKFSPLIKAFLSIPDEVEFDFLQLSLELQGFGNMPFLKKADGPSHPNLPLYLKKCILLHPQALPCLPSQGPFSEWANRQRNDPFTPLSLTTLETLFSLLEMQALSEDEIETAAKSLEWNEPMTISHLLDRLIVEGDMQQYLPRWLNMNHRGNWENTLDQLLSTVKANRRREIIKIHLEDIIGSELNRDELYLAAFSHQLFKPDEKAQRLFLHLFSDYTGDPLAQFLQKLAPSIRQKKWLIDLWINAFLSGKIAPEYLCQRIVVWLNSNLFEEQKRELVLDLIQRCPVDLFNDECLIQIIPRLNNGSIKEKWLHSLLKICTMERFLRLIEETSEMESSPELLTDHLWNCLKERRMTNFIFLITHEVFCKRVQIPLVVLKEELNKAALESGEIDALLNVDHLPLKEAVACLPMTDEQIRVFTRHLFGMIHHSLPNDLIQYLFERIVEDTKDYLEELRTHSNWIVDAFKEDCEKLHRLFRVFRLPIVTVLCQPPQILLKSLSAKPPHELDLELSISLMNSSGGDCLYIPVLKAMLASDATDHFKAWLCDAFPRLKTPQRHELLRLVQDRKEELITLFEYIIIQPMKNLQNYFELLLQSLFNVPEVAETFDLKRINHLFVGSIKAFQRFFEKPELLTRFIQDYFLPHPKVSKEILEGTVVQADAFHLLDLLIAAAPKIRNLLPKEGLSFLNMRRVGATAYLNLNTGSHEWLYEMPDYCSDPILNQLSIIRLVDQGIDFSTDASARAFLNLRIRNIITLRQELGAAWINYSTIGTCIEKICSRNLFPEESELSTGLFEWVTAIGLDPTQTVNCRSGMLQLSFLKGSTTISEEAIAHLFALLPHIKNVPSGMMRGLIFALTQYPQLPIRPLQDKIDHLLFNGTVEEQEIALVLSRYLDLILCNRLEGHHQERLECCLTLLQAAIQAKLELFDSCYSDEIIRSIGLNFLTPEGQALSIKDQWIESVNQANGSESLIQTRLRCIAHLNEQIFKHATTETFSGLLVMVAQDITALINELKGGYNRTLPLLQRLLEISVSSPYYSNTIFQADTVLPLLPHLGKAKLIYYYILLFISENLAMPSGDYLKRISLESELELIDKALDTFLIRGDATAANCSKRIYFYSLTKKFPFAKRLSLFEKTVILYFKARIPIDITLSLVDETVKRLPNVLTDKQRASFAAMIEKHYGVIKKSH